MKASPTFEGGPPRSVGRPTQIGAQTGTLVRLLGVTYVLVLLIRPNEMIAALATAPILQSLLIAWLAAWAFSRERMPPAFPQFWYALWLAAAVVLSAGANGWWGGAQVHAEYLGPIYILFVLVASMSRDLRFLRSLMVASVGAAALMVLHGHVQATTGVGWTGLPLAWNRITYAGIFNDPNDLGQLFAICLVFCAYLIRTSGAIARVLFAAIALALLYGVYLTNSRGTLLAVLAVLGLWAVRRYGKVAAAALGAAVLPVLMLTTRLSQVSTGEQSAAERVESWYAGLQMFFTHPVFGVGRGNYLEHHSLTAHNSIILPLAELGLFGFVAWTGIVWTTFLMTRVLYRGPRHQTPRAGVDAATVAAEEAAGRTIASAAIAFAVSSMFLSQSYKHMFFLVAALVVGRFTAWREIFEGLPAPSAGRELMRTFAAAFALIVFMWFITRVLL